VILGGIKPLKKAFQSSHTPIKALFTKSTYALYGTILEKVFG
jgi:hypothetical protein